MCGACPGVAAKRRNPRLSTGIASRLGLALVDACDTPQACSSKAGGVGASPRPPVRDERSAQRRRRFRGINPAPSHATLTRRRSSCAFPRRPLRGLGRARRVTGGRGEAPQPPAVNGNRFAIGPGIGQRVRHAEGVFVESRGCRHFADTPGRNDRHIQRRRRFRGIGPPRWHATLTRRRRSCTFPRRPRRGRGGLAA